MRDLGSGFAGEVEGCDLGVRSRGTVLRSRLARCCDDQTRFKREREIEKEREKERLSGMAERE